jgi:hypothetical protein
MRAESKLRKQDEKMEKIVAKFLDETFYHEDTSVFVRNTNKELQIRGVDTIFTLNGTTYVCDEKSTAQYRDINTFTLELSFIDIYDHPSIGWLIDDDNVNNSYLLAWLDSDKVEVALVEKNTVLKHLESLGWTKERLFRKQEKIREAFDHGRFEPLGNLDRDGLKFHYSTNLVERPINVMLFRDTYRQLSVFNKCYLTKQFAKK